MLFISVGTIISVFMGEIGILYNIEESVGFTAEFTKSKFWFKKKEKPTLNLLPCYFMIKVLVSDIFTFTASKYSACFFVFINILQFSINICTYGDRTERTDRHKPWS